MLNLILLNSIHRGIYIYIYRLARQTTNKLQIINIIFSQLKCYENIQDKQTPNM